MTPKKVSLVLVLSPAAKETGLKMRLPLPEKLAVTLQLWASVRWMRVAPKWVRPAPGAGPLTVKLLKLKSSFEPRWIAPLQEVGTRPPGPGTVPLKMD